MRTSLCVNGVSVALNLVAIQGAGKDTLGLNLELELPVTHLVMSQLLEAEVKRDTGRGRRLRRAMANAEMGHDDDVCPTILEAFASSDAAKPLILNGFSRSPRQAQTLARACRESKRHLIVIDLMISATEAAQRILNGRVKERSEQGLSIRLDDTLEGIHKRHADFLANFGSIRNAFLECNVDWATVCVAGLNRQETVEAVIAGFSPYV